MNRMIDWLLNPPPYGRASIFILRLMAGAVFFWEGLLKFVYPNQGVGRFTKLGFPFPETTAHFVATAEIIGGLLIMAGLFTRLVALYFIAQMIVAILTTKISLYLGTSPLPLPPAPPKAGLWAVLHEIRSDYAQVLVSLFLLLEGAGRFSLDTLRRSGLKNRLKTPDRQEVILPV
ncbi:DoxX family protein [Flavitalea flava]